MTEKLKEAICEDNEKRKSEKIAESNKNRNSTSVQMDGYESLKHQNHILLLLILVNRSQNYLVLGLERLLVMMRL